MSERDEDRRMKAKIEDLSTKLIRAKEKKAQMEGALKQLTKQLKEEFGCSSTEEARKKIATLTAKIQETRAEIAEKIEAVTKEYEL